MTYGCISFILIVTDQSFTGCNGFPICDYLRRFAVFKGSLVLNYISYVDTPLGKVLLSSDGKALTGLWFEGQKYYGSTLSGDLVEKPVPVFDQTEQWLSQYFSGISPDFMPPVAPQGTAFQKSVWEILLTIPYGRTTTYGEIAKVIARQRGQEHFSAQTVGNAVGRNPISIIIPCHRVVGADGGLVGYAGGLDRKRKLLAYESSDRISSPTDLTSCLRTANTISMS